MTQRALASFGAGRLYGIRTDLANQTPVEFAVLQDCTRDFSFTTKPLFGQNQLAIFVARGEAKWSIKAKVGVFSGLLLNEMFFGQTLASGQTQLQAAESHVYGATVVIAPPNSGTFVADEGVVYADTLMPLTLSTSAPSTGQYEVNAGTGTYTFAAGDSTRTFLISYTYAISGSGQKIALTNQLLGTTPFFSGVFRNRDPENGTFNTFVINRMTSEKLTLASKTSDYEIPEFDMQIMDDGTGNIGTMSFGDLS